MTTQTRVPTADGYVGHKKISYSHGYCGKECIKVSKELSKKKKK
jgi:hypothetical protein